MSAALCGPDRVRDLYRSTATSAGTRQITSTARMPVLASSRATLASSLPGCIQMSTTVGSDDEARLSASLASAARRSSTPSSTPPDDSKSVSLIVSKSRNRAPIASASARPRVVLPDPGTPDTSTVSSARSLIRSSSRIWMHLWRQWFGGPIRDVDQCAPVTSQVPSWLLSAAMLRACPPRGRWRSIPSSYRGCSYPEFLTTAFSEEFRSWMTT